ncbi:MAG: TRM11 family methyltransferase [Actinomycetota bacterium]
MTNKTHPRLRKLVLKDPQHERNTHYLFRFPAKFHPPVVKTLLETWTSENETVLDPFCGSGTLMVEAALSSRAAIGVDVDPLAVLVSQVKSQPLKSTTLRKTQKALLEKLERLERPDADYERFMYADISEKQVWVRNLSSRRRPQTSEHLEDLGRRPRKDADALPPEDRLQAFVPPF